MWRLRLRSSRRLRDFPQVICLGDINLDIIAPISRYPELGEDAYAEQPSVSPGGSAANTAAILTRLGVRAGLIGRVGTDPLGVEVLSRLASFGIDLSRVQRDPGAVTGLMFIPIVPGGERTMFGFRGANTRLSLSPMDREYVTQARLLHVSGYSLLASPQREAAFQAIAWARMAGRPVSLDAGLEVVRQQPEVLAQVLPGLTLLLPGEAEAAVLAGRQEPEQAVRTLLGRDIRIVALKRGPAGCVVGGPKGIFAVPAFSVQSVDTTGAGDAFDAGFIAAWLRGLDLRAAALLGNAVGALATTRSGANPPDLDELRSFLAQQRYTSRWDGWDREFDALDRLLK